MKKCRISKKKKKWLKTIIIIMIVLIAVFSYFHFYVNPLIVDTNVASIKASAVDVINEATLKTITGNDYDNLITITKDADGNVAMLQVNSAYVNKLNNDLLVTIQNSLNAENSLEYKLPLGSFLGIPILNGIGPDVSLKIVPIGNAKTKFNSQIASLSINQSYHKIYLTVSVEICVVLPLYTKNVTVTNQVLIGENIIVGKIPSTYLNTDNLTNALNLIP